MKTLFRYFGQNFVPKGILKNAKLQGRDEAVGFNYAPAFYKSISPKKDLQFYKNTGSVVVLLL